MAKINKETSDKIISKVRAFISEGVSHCDEKHRRAEEAQAYVRGEQWSKGDLHRQEARERPAVPWNSVFKVVSAISNREIVERFMPKVFGRNANDAGIAGVLDEASKWQRQMSASEHLESMAFRSATMCGYGWMHKYWDPTANNGRGLIKDEDVPVWEMLWPSRSRQMNLIDRQWHVRGRWIDVDQAESLWGTASAKAKKAFKTWQSSGSKAAGALTDTNMPDYIPTNDVSFGWESVRTGKWINKASRELFVCEAEWMETQYMWRCAIPVRFAEWEAFVLGGMPLAVPYQDPETGEQSEQQIQLAQYQQLSQDQRTDFMYQILSDADVITIETRKELNEFSDRYEAVTGEEYNDYEMVASQEVKFAIVIDNLVVEYGKRDYGFSYFAITGFPFESRGGMDFFGTVDIAKGPQDYKNALISNMLAMYMSSPKAPMLVAKSAVPNIEQLTNQISSPSAIGIVPDDFIQGEGTKYRILPSPEYPPMLGPLLDLASSGVEEAFGLSSIDLGNQSDLRRVSGTVVQAARASGNVIVAILYDALRLFRKQYGLCNIKFIKKMYTVDDIVRIVGEEKFEDIGNITGDWGDIFSYDVVIDEQPSSPTEMMELVDFLTRTGTLDNWRNRGDIEFEDMLKMMPQIPESVKRDILKNRTVRDQLNQSQQQIQELQQTMQSLYQYLQGQQNGDQLLNAFTQMREQQEAAQQMFSTQGVPQAQQQPA